MTDATTQPVIPERPGGEQRHIARGALLQQGSQVWGTLCMLLVATVLGRTLTTSEFGVYGLLISLVAYLVTVQVSVEGAAVRTLAAAEAQEAESRREAFSTTLAIYAVGGVLAAVIVAVGGVALVGVLGIPEGLQNDAREAVLGLAAVTALGWPFKVCQDALRGAQLFGAAAAGEILAYTTVAVGICLAVGFDAPLWVDITIGGALSALIGVWCGASLIFFKVEHRFRVSDIRPVLAREMLGMSAYLFAAGLADLVIYSLDRVVLAAFRSVEQVGLYEGAVRPHNLLRQLHGTLVLTVVPVASGYIAAGDTERVRALFLRGTRYVVAIVAPATLVLVILAAPLLEVWLGPRFRDAALPLALFSSYWLVGCNTGVGTSMLVAAGNVKVLARFAWAVAIANLAVSLALTPWLGLNGVVLGTLIPNVLSVPFLVRIMVRHFPITIRDLARDVWIPVYSVCLPAAAVLVAIRVFAEPANLLGLAAAAIAGLAVAWGLFWTFFMSSNERRLVLSFVPFVNRRVS
jgi:O-antigen/teichoic acid export membrane protein